MITIKDRQILVDGVPRIVLAGEIHYFRTPPEHWRNLLVLAKESGCTAIASYIPWLWHELPDGTIDVSGTTHPARDVGRFIDLCHELGLWFIARPGPFQMAELKNEGIPYRIYREHPEVVPTGWDGRPCPSATVDYLSPAFLTETRRWYQAVIPVIASRLHDAGGPVIAVQLDNEVGMLAWVTNTPDLTDHLLADFRGWIERQELTERYPAEVLADEDVFAQAVRSPDEQWAGALRIDLARFMRGRFARYVAQLRADAEEFGIHGVPFLVNIHGTEGGGGEPFPIGISQLMETWAGIEGMVAGSDHYVGDLNFNTLADLYVMNAFQASVNDADQPLTSLEFEAGTGDYGGALDLLYDPATTDLKTRLFLAQGNRLINYYLLAGGTNPFLDQPVGDGDDRISFTGERHGTAAPITPEGTAGISLPPVARVARATMVHEPWLATATEQLDNISLAFIPDAFATEYAHPGSEVMQRVAGDLQPHRGAGQRRALARSLVLQGYRFDAVHLPAWRPRAVDGAPLVLLVATAEHMAAETQQAVVDHLAAGGSALMIGPVPHLDLEDRPCTVLVDALGLVPGARTHDGPHQHPTMVATSWLAPLPQVRTGWLQAIEGGEPVLTDLYGAACGVEVRHGAGRAVLIAGEVGGNLLMFRRLLDRLGARHDLALDSQVPGMWATTTVDASGSRLLHLMNITGYTPEVTVTLDGEVVGGGPMVLAPRSGWMLPLGVEVPQGRVLWANAEIISHSDAMLAFGDPIMVDGRSATRVVIDSERVPVAAGCRVERTEDGWEVTGGGRLVITFAE